MDVIIAYKQMIFIKIEDSELLNSKWKLISKDGIHKMFGKIYETQEISVSKAI